jgi:hypothetical protein
MQYNDAEFSTGELLVEQKYEAALALYEPKFIKEMVDDGVTRS